MTFANYKFSPYLSIIKQRHSGDVQNWYSPPSVTGMINQEQIDEWTRSMFLMFV
jgi:hypothetical protein